MLKITLKISLLLLTCSAIQAQDSDSCPLNRGGAGISVFDEGGTVAVSGDGQCATEVIGAPNIGVNPGNLTQTGDECEQPTCGDQQCNGTGIYAERIDLPDFLTSTFTDTITKNNNLYTFSNSSRNEFGTLILTNGATAYFQVVTSSPFIIKTLEAKACNDREMVFEPGDYFIENLTIENGCNVSVSGLGDGTGQVRLYLQNGLQSNSELRGGEWNYDSNLSVSEQHSEKLALFAYSGNVVIEAGAKIAAFIYVDQGDLLVNAGETYIVGELEATDISFVNSTHYYYQDAYYQQEILDYEVSLAQPAVHTQSQVGDLSYIVYQTENPSSGHLKAFELTASGTTSAVPAWDAADQMSVASRALKLYSYAGGMKTLFTELDAALFGVAALETPNVNTIKNYTIDPSYQDGAYLAGYETSRMSTSLLGRPDRTDPKLLDPPEDIALENDPDYVAYGELMNTRNKLALFTSDDGFMYAVSEQSGALEWAWMPQTFLPHLKDYQRFQDQHHFRGQFSIVDAKNASGNYATYITGSALSGALQYSVKLDSSLFDRVVWEKYTEYSSSPNQEGPVIYRHMNDTFAVYLQNNPISFPGKSHLIFDNVARTGGDRTLVIDQLISATPHLKEDSVFLGAETGQALSIEINGFSFSSPTVIPNIHLDEPLKYIGSVSYKNKDYMRLQGDHSIAVAVNEDGEWKMLWLSEINTAGDYDETGDYHSNPELLSLPLESFISDQAVFAGGVLFVPVSVASDCGNDAYIYTYNLETGEQASNVQYQGSDINGPVFIGQGESRTPVITRIGDKLILEGHSDINRVNEFEEAAQGLDDPFSILNSLKNSIFAWREIYGLK